MTCQADTPFDGLYPTQGHFRLTFDQTHTANSCDIGAVFTSRGGKTMPMRVQIRDAERARIFREGLGALLTDLYHEAFVVAAERRAKGKTTNIDAPDVHAPILHIDTYGAWDTSFSTPVYVLAQWHWTDPDGAEHSDGWLPERTYLPTSTRRPQAA